MNHPDEGGDAVKTKRLVDAELDLVGHAFEVGVGDAFPTHETEDS